MAPSYYYSDTGYTRCKLKDNSYFHAVRNDIAIWAGLPLVCVCGANQVVAAAKAEAKRERER